MIVETHQKSILSGNLTICIRNTCCRALLNRPS